MEALAQLDSILSEQKCAALKARPEFKNIKIMLELFSKDKFKDIVLLVDSHEDMEHINQKKVGTLLEIFESTTDKDRLSLITISRKVNVVYSLSVKSKNTIQLRNQLCNLSWDKTSRCNYVKGLATGINELTAFTSPGGDRYILCITSSKDLKSFSLYQREEMIIKDAIEKNKIKLLVILITDKPEELGQLKNYFPHDSIFLTNPSPKVIREIIRSISNISLGNQELVFERFE